MILCVNHYSPHFLSPPPFGKDYPRTPPLRTPFIAPLHGFALLACEHSLPFFLSLLLLLKLGIYSQNMH